MELGYRIIAAWRNMLNQEHINYKTNRKHHYVNSINVLLRRCLNPYVEPCNETGLQMFAMTV
jgi:hypothetical protein